MRDERCLFRTRFLSLAERVSSIYIMHKFLNQFFSVLFWLYPFLAVLCLWFMRKRFGVRHTPRHQLLVQDNQEEQAKWPCFANGSFSIFTDGILFLVGFMDPIFIASKGGLASVLGIDRMWEFSVALYFISLWPSSLLFAAIYGTVESACTALFGAIVGKWVDMSTYTKVLRIWLLTQSFSFLIAGGMVMELLFHSNLKLTNFVAFISLVILICFSGAVGVLSALAGSILIEREWVVVISEGHPPETLTRMNSVIRRIDLISKLFAPVVSGFFVSFASLKASAVAFALWNFVSVWLQYWLMSSVYSGIPALRESNQRRKQQIPSDGTSGRVSTLGGMLHDEASVHGTEEKSLMRRKMNLVKNSTFMVSWRTYLRQEVVLPGMALALLYFTVLSFGTLMTADLKWEGIPPYVIGIGRGISATIGIAATLLYPFLHSHISTLRTGLWSIWCQWTFLVICVASIWVQNKHLSVYMLMGGVATSRLGLWMFDLSVTQLMQDGVLECDRGAVGGVQSSLQSALDLMSSVMGIIISDPRDFWKLTLASFLTVTLAAILYCLHVYRVRKHLVHMEKLLILVKW